MNSLDKVKVLAGLIVGEGWIGMTKAMPKGRSISPIYAVVMTITNTNTKLISWLIENFGGNFYSMKNQTDKHKEGYTWKISNNQLCPILKQVLPYLIIKDEQAKIVMAYLEHKLIDPATFGRGNRLSMNELDYRESVHIALKKLNRKGPSESVTTNTSDNSNELKIESELNSNVKNRISDNLVAE